VKDRFEFPTLLDMRPFTREGADEVAPAPPAAGDAAASGSAPPQPGGPPGAPRLPDDAYAYTLMGVVVHSGSAFAGHYYSYIRERVTSPDGTVAPGPWHVFDDKRVEPYDAANLERDTFGGRYSTEVWDANRKQHVPMEYDRPNSAYMLFYDRLDAAAEGGAAASASALSPGPGPDGDVAMEAAPPAVRLPARVAAEVRAANAQCVYEAHALNREYFAFVRGLVDANAELYSRKRRREAPAAAAAAAALAAASAPQPTADQLCCELAAEFLMTVYSRAAPALRDDSAHWVATLTGLLESSRTACYWFLGWLLDPERASHLRLCLVRAPGEDVRELWGKLCAAALRAAVLHGEGAGDYEELMDRVSPVRASVHARAHSRSRALTRCPSHARAGHVGRRADAAAARPARPGACAGVPHAGATEFAHHRPRQGGAAPTGAHQRAARVRKAWRRAARAPGGRARAGDAVQHCRRQAGHLLPAAAGQLRCSGLRAAQQPLAHRARHGAMRSCIACAVLAHALALTRARCVHRAARASLHRAARGRPTRTRCLAARACLRSTRRCTRNGTARFTRGTCRCSWRRRVRCPTRVTCSATSAGTTCTQRALPCSCY
jgi:hypothetical protein